jgi:hypothetical protein
MRPEFRYSDLGNLNKQNVEKYYDGIAGNDAGWITSEGIQVKNCYTSKEIEGSIIWMYASRHPTVSPRAICRHVSDASMTIGSTQVFPLLKRFECLLQAQPCCRAEGSFSCIRPWQRTGGMILIMSVLQEMWEGRVAVDSVLDMKILFDRIPLGKNVCFNDNEWSRAAGLWLFLYSYSHGAGGKTGKILAEQFRMTFSRSSW